MAKKSMTELPVIRHTENIHNLTDLDGKLQISIINGPTRGLPEYFYTEMYSIEFLTQGSVTADINHHRFVIDAPSCVCIFPNHILRLLNMSEDCQFTVLSFSPQLGGDLHLNMGNELLSNVYIRPVVFLEKEQLDMGVQYLTLLNNIVQTPDIVNVYDVAIDLVRSLILLMSGIYDKTFHNRFSLSRAEEHVGHFLSLVDVYSREHHSLDWYASKMCLSPQYMANIVKQVTSKSAGEHIYENLIRQARTLLLSTNMSVQEIADQLGFRNQSHFGTFFRRSVGVSPKAFRTGGE